ncbi:MAG: hypothetical protein FH753_00715 [Firmicutes bacterium]|nr:hypothetical protein [Bacillota bacterium]
MFHNICNRIFCKFTFKESSKSIEDIKKYIDKGMRAKMIADGIEDEGGVSLLSFSMDKYTKFSLVFFVTIFIFSFNNLTNC